MNTMKLLSVFAILITAGLLSIQSQPSEEGTILSVKVLEGEKLSVEALVGVSTSEENLENSEYILEGETNSKGICTFKSIQAGTYYLDASNEDFYGEGKVTVSEGTASLTINMTLD